MPKTMHCSVHLTLSYLGYQLTMLELQRWLSPSYAVRGSTGKNSGIISRIKNKDICFWAMTN